MLQLAVLNESVDLSFKILQPFKPPHKWNIQLNISHLLNASQCLTGEQVAEHCQNLPKETEIRILTFFIPSVIPTRWKHFSCSFLTQGSTLLWIYPNSGHWVFVIISALNLYVKNIASIVVSITFILCVLITCLICPVLFWFLFFHSPSLWLYFLLLSSPL